jgi:hypothetical protein
MVNLGSTLSQYKNELKTTKEQLHEIEEELKMTKHRNNDMCEEIDYMVLEKKAKLKFLASSLLFNQIESLMFDQKRIRNSFTHWRSKLICHKVIFEIFLF